MTALVANFARARAGDNVLNPLRRPMGVLASTHIYAGALVALTLAGYLVPASADPTLYVVGIAEEEANDTSGVSGTLSLVPRRGVYPLTNSGSTDAITAADVGRPCYVVDDDTVARTNPLGLRPHAGTVVGLDAAGKVLVEIGALPRGQESHDLLIVTAADLSAAQGLFVALNSAGLAVLAATAGQAALGGLVNAPASGAVAIIRRRGLLRMVFSDSTVEGAPVAVTVTTGRAKTAVAGTVSGSNVVGSHAMGTCLEESSGAGDTALVDLHPMGVLPTTLA